MNEKDVGNRIQMLSRQIKRRMDMSVSEYGITGKQMSILLYIDEESREKASICKRY